MAKVETTLTLEQLDAALKLNGSLRAFDAGYAKGFAAGLEAGAEMLHSMGPATQDMTSTFICEALERAATALRERAREEKAKP